VPEAERQFDLCKALGHVLHQLVLRETENRSLGRAMLLRRPLSSRQWFKAMSVSCHCVTDQSARVPEQKPA